MTAIPSTGSRPRDVILKAKPYWAAFNASSYIRELSSGNIWVVHGYSNDIYQADLGRAEGGKKFRIRHSLPKEGAVLALDAMVIAKSAPRPDLAYKFINFMLEGQNSADLTNMIGSGNPNEEAHEVHQAARSSRSRPSFRTSRRPRSWRCSRT